MQQTNPTHDQEETATHPRAFRRLLILAIAALILVLLVLLPPLISVNRYRHRIAASIGASLGRPVHLDKVTLNLLPLPGFTLENFVVDEDPAFGSEPIIRANSVRATLRMTSLWRRRVEFSTISLTEPSVNLVHTSAGKWNLDSILLHAAHVAAAPTAQRSAGPAPRFPYIEATGARLNLKLDNEKTPFSLTDADFALWLPEPQQWHLRLSAHPARTDTSASDTGILQVEGTLGRAASLDHVPVNLKGEWRNAPLGAASLILLGRDAGLRGDLTLSANVQGTVGHSGMQATLRLSGARRADFVPAQLLDLQIQCLGTATSAFYSYQDLRCNWPPAGFPNAPTLAISGALPDIRAPRAAYIDIATPGLPAATLLEWFRVASSRVPPDISAAGTLTGNLAYGTAPPDPTPGTLTGDTTPSSPTQALHANTPSAQPSLANPTPAGWHGQLFLTGARLINPAVGPDSLIAGDLDLHSASQLNNLPEPTTSSSFILDPIALALGGKDPATLEGRFDANGYTLHLTGMASLARIRAFAAAIPLFSDGLAEALPTNRFPGPFHVDLTATRIWGTPQTWTDNTTHPTSPRPTSPRRESRP